MDPDPTVTVEPHYASLSDGKRCQLLKQIGTEVPNVLIPALRRDYIHFFYYDGIKRLIDLPGSPYHGRDLDEAVLWDGRVSPRLEGRSLHRFLEELAISEMDTRERTQAREVLAGEYKIHLMPKAEYIPWMTERLCVIVSESKTFRHTTCGFKVKVNPRPDQVVRNGETIDYPQTLPIIVAYLHHGRQNAQRALDIVRKMFGHRSRELGLGVTPRYSVRVDDLIYYAQCGGDFKNEYLRARQDRSLANTLLGGDLVHMRGPDHELNCGSPDEDPTVPLPLPGRRM